jgi:predicted esterase
VAKDAHPDSEGEGDLAATEHRLQVARTARYWTLGQQPSDDVWIALHGYRQLARRFLRRFVPLDDGSRLIVAPEALSRFYVGTERGRHGPESVVGATWMTREAREDEIRDYVAYLDRLAGTVLRGGERLTVLGFSQGVATACRWVTLGAVRPARLVLWGDFLPPDLELERAAEALADTEVVLVRGGTDASLTSDLASREAERLESSGIVYRRIFYEGGHDIDAGTLLGLARF